MNQRYIDYATYNVWANRKLIESLLLLDESLISKEVKSSFPTIRKTLLHIWFAEMGWLSRLNGNGWKTTKVDDFSGSYFDLFNEWKSTSEEFQEFVGKADLEIEVSFKRDDKVYSIPSREIAQTVFNHGTFHRGQIVTMMRQLGVRDIPKTDYIEWVRENA